MRKFIFMTISCLASCLHGNSQTDSLPVVGIANFTSEVESRFCKSVTEKVVQLFTQSHRFQVVDRTNYAKVKEELELQKTEEFIDSKTRAAQGVSLAAQYLVVGHIVKSNVYAMKNPDGSINGYKASISFQLQVNDVAKGSSTTAESFQTSVSKLMFSPEGAINDALNSIDEQLHDWLVNNFPVNVKLLKILDTRKESATLVLIGGGKAFGIDEGDKFSVQKIQQLNGLPYPTDIGQIRVRKLAGDNFAECSVIKGGSEILSTINERGNLNCLYIK